MTSRSRSRAQRILTTLAVAIGIGALAGAIAAGFIWLIEETVAAVWHHLPERLGVDAFDSWWLVAIPVIGGGLVGVGQRVLGDYPRPISEALDTWRAGGRIEPAVAPRAGVNSLVALAAGGPVGFEAALTGVLGGTATWVGQRITAVAEWNRDAWATDDSSRPAAAERLPYWAAGVASLYVYRWLPFGGIDMGFRFTDFGRDLSVGQGLAALGVAALIAVPAAWAIATVGRAEHSRRFTQAPILSGMGGGLVLAMLAMPNHLVLFSGQEGIQLLPDTASGDLFYVAIAKWVALVIVMYAGWRGGPIFPTYTSAAALGVLAANALDIRADVMIVAAVAAVSVVFMKGNVPVAALLTLYAVDFSYTAVILVGCIGGAAALALAGAAAILPRPGVETEQSPTAHDTTAVPDPPDQHSA